MELHGRVCRLVCEPRPHLLHQRWHHLRGRARLHGAVPLLGRRVRGGGPAPHVLEPQGASHHANHHDRAALRPHFLGAQRTPAPMPPLCCVSPAAHVPSLGLHRWCRRHCGRTQAERSCSLALSSRPLMRGPASETWSRLQDWASSCPLPCTHSCSTPVFRYDPCHRSCARGGDRMLTTAPPPWSSCGRVAGADPVAQIAQQRAVPGLRVGVRCHHHVVHYSQHRHCAVLWQRDEGVSECELEQVHGWLRKRPGVAPACVWPCHCATASHTCVRATRRAGTVVGAVHFVHGGAVPCA